MLKSLKRKVGEEGAVNVGVMFAAERWANAKLR